MKNTIRLAGLVLAMLASGSFTASNAQQSQKSKAAAKSAQTAPAPAAAPADTANGAAQNTPAPPGWTARCASASRDAPLECAVEQNAVLPRTGQLVIAVNIRVPADTHTPSALIQLPLGLNIPAGAKLQVDDGKTVDLQIQTCDPIQASASKLIPPALFAPFSSAQH